MWTPDFSWNHALVCNLLLEMLTSRQAMKLMFGRKRAVRNLQNRLHFQKLSRDQVNENNKQLYLSKRIPDISFNFISCQEICK